MIKARALVLHAGTRDSYGKDAEAAIAWGNQSSFTRMQNIGVGYIPCLGQNGVAIGAMAATSPEEVVTLLKRIENDLEFELQQHIPNTWMSVVRLQTSDDLIRETHYHSDR